MMMTRSGPEAEAAAAAESANLGGPSDPLAAQQRRRQNLARANGTYMPGA